MVHTLLLVLSILFTSAPVAQTTGSVVVTVVNLQGTKGTVYFYLYDSDDGFPTDFEQARRSASAVVRGSEAKAVFDNLPAGTYAVAVYHDEDGDGELDTNFLGIPSEGVGVSRNAKGSFGPPSFKDAKFVVQASAVSLSITMKY